MEQEEKCNTSIFRKFRYRKIRCERKELRLAKGSFHFIVVQDCQCYICFYIVSDFIFVYKLPVPLTTVVANQLLASQ
jgi:hypothetical protein